MIRRMNKWIKRYSRSAICIILLSIFFITFLLEGDYFFAISFFAFWCFLVKKLVVYIKTDEEANDIISKNNYIIKSVEIDEDGRKHCIIREYNKQGKVVASTDFNDL